MRTLIPLLFGLAACASSPPESLSDCGTKDPIDVSDLSLDGSTLDIGYGHGGGCAEHTIVVCWDGSINDSLPPQTSLTLWHDDGGDSCEAYLSGTISVDIQPVLDATGRPVELSVDGETLLIE